MYTQYQIKTTDRKIDPILPNQPDDGGRGRGSAIFQTWSVLEKVAKEVVGGRGVIRTSTKLDKMPHLVGDASQRVVRRGDGARSKNEARREGGGRLQGAQWAEGAWAEQAAATRETGASREDDKRGSEEGD